MSQTTQSSSDSGTRTILRRGLPFLIFMSIAVLFFIGLFRGDPSRLPSALLGKAVPEFDLPPLEGLKRDGAPVAGVSTGDLAKGRVSIVNFWASWCVPCRIEHPFLVQLAAESKAPIYGMNYKDSTTGARRFLGRFGSPFAAVGVDAKGSTAIDWGVYGIPETFIIDGDGTILHKQVGPINADIIAKKLLPVIEKARAKNRGAGS